MIPGCIAAVVAPGPGQPPKALNFELFGQLNNAIDERHAWYDLQARVMANLIGLPAASGD